MTQIPSVLGPRQPAIRKRGANALLLWRARDGLTTPLTEDTTMSALVALQSDRPFSKDAIGRFQKGVTYKVPFNHWDLDGDGFCETPALRTVNALLRNYCPYSEDFTNWTATNTPSIIARTVTCGEVVLSLLSDANATLQAYYERTLNSIGAAKGVASFFIAKGNINSATGSRFEIFDSTAAAVRARANWTWNVNAAGINVPSVTAATGKVVVKEYVGRFTYLHQTTNALQTVDVWRIGLLTTAAYVTGNTNVARCYPAASATEQGNEFFGGIMFAQQYGVYVRNTAATSTLPDSHIMRWAFKPVPSAMTMAVRFVYTGGPEWYPASGSGYVAAITDTSGTLPILAIFGVESGGNGFYQGVLWQAAGNNSAVLAVTPSVGDIVMLRLTMRSDGSIVIGQTINSGPETTATSSTQFGVPAAWPANAVFRLNESGIGGEDYLAVGAFAGEPSAAYMEALLK